MISISKILTLNKIDILSFNGSIIERNDYFSLGNPILDPPTLRGTVIVELNYKFLTDNKEFFIYGSPIDIGGVEFGFIKVNRSITDFVDSAKCDYNKFSSIISGISNNPASLEMMKLHTYSEHSLKVIENAFDSSVFEVISSSNSPHLCMFEFCLRKGYRLAYEYVEKIFIPNTYASSELFSEIVESLSSKVIVYNPKYGIESYA
ncbi:hypothetical protein [Enterovibrio coralii]|uniref:Uncharacterized protein n=1 Tax=Enterovibrio coralii TaxID=294935 RepID=A0A135IA00_9GAMM|nr:hypothetical protein [Enterovibrio coralii]KXF82214.1 hypothetical protein ATN88_24970 [Enterovibrio coralii]